MKRCKKTTKGNDNAKGLHPNPNPNSDADSNLFPFSLILVVVDDFIAELVSVGTRLYVPAHSGKGKSNPKDLLVLRIGYDNFDGLTN
jgi:hypothetical protein